jgi:hypothetical protein
LPSLDSRRHRVDSGYVTPSSPNAGFVDVYFREIGLDDKYESTSWGELYLEGEVDAELQRPCPAVRPPDKVRPGWWAGFG